jgi:cyclophilin family peptidyl-prolyl cis-trans isomerase/HEAT repeat protein
VKKLILPVLLFTLCVTSVSCRRRRLQPDEIERNRYFAQILAREDSRDFGTDGFFEATLASAPDPEVREWCAVALGRIGDPRALPLLYGALTAKEAGLRAAAAFAVGEIEDRDLVAREGRSPDPSASREISRLLGDPSLSVQGRASEALGKIGGPAEASEILRHVSVFRYEGTPLQRSYLALSIAALMRLKSPEAFPVLRGLAFSGDPEIQWRAANALVRMQDRAAVTVFLQLLESPYPEVQAYAARGIGITGSSPFAEKLLPLLPPRNTGTGRLNPLSVRVCAVQSLGKLRNATAIPAIGTALGAVPVDARHPDQVNFAREAANALGELGDPAGVDLLENLTQLPGPVSESAVIALARLLKDDPDRFFALLKIEAFQQPSGKRALAQALAALGGERAAAELKRMLGRAVMEPAASDMLELPSILTALARLSPSDLQEILRPFLTSSDPVVLRAAVSAYKPAAGTGEPWAAVLDAYRAAVATGDLETKMSVLSRLGEWGTVPRVQAELIGALHDRQRNVRIIAAKYLRATGLDNLPSSPGPVAGAPFDLCLALATVRKDRSIAVLETTRGDIDLELFAEDAPLTVANFVALAKRGIGQEAFRARRGFFDGLSFMRVVPFFVVQGGDPRNDQEGGPGYSIRCEINLRPFERGSVGMALAGKDTGGSQFFITLAPQPHLDGGYTCFGRVISGMQVVEQLTPGDRIKKVTIKDESTLFDQRLY